MPYNKKSLIATVEMQLECEHNLTVGDMEAFHEALIQSIKRATADFLNSKKSSGFDKRILKSSNITADLFEKESLLK